MNKSTKNMLLHDFLINSAKRFPQKEAVIHGGNRYTYSQIFTAAGSAANWISGLNPESGFRAAILSDDPFEYISAYFAVLMAGGTVVGLNTQTSERSLRTIINDCTPEILFTQSKYWKYLDKLVLDTNPLSRIVMKGGAAPDLMSAGTSIHSLDEILGFHSDYKAVREILPSDLAQIIYTSGTTGEPKGVMLRHVNLAANTRSIVEYLKLAENDKVMAVLPFFYSYGNSILLTHFAVGGTLVVNQSFLYPNVILDEMVQEEVTGFSGVPSTFAILLNRSAISSYHFPKLRYLTQAGAAMSPALAEKLRRLFPETEIFIMYGQTEASARLSYLPPCDLTRKPGSIGKAIPGVRLTLLDKNADPVPVGETGEIVARGDNIMAGYWGKADETARVIRPEGLWTGDLARMDEDGYLYIVSRKSDMIKSGSHRIAPKEIEEIILEHDAVHEAAVVGVEDEMLGELIKACVVLKPGANVVERELIIHCRKNLPAFKVPHRIDFLDELPKTATGKIRKQGLTPRLTIEESPLKPHIAYGRAFIRVGATNQKLDRDQYEYLLRQRMNGYGFDHQACNNADLGDIDEESVYECIEIANSVRSFNENLMLPVDALMEKLGLMREDGITNAALLLFGKKPDKFFPNQFEIRCGDFPTDNGYDHLLNEQEYRNNLISNFNSAISFIVKSIKKKTSKGPIHRNEQLEYPAAVLREALVNMIVHRDYRQGIKSTIEIRPSVISFYNPAQLFEPTITIERLKRIHPSRPGNKMIAKVFYLMGLFENWGSGTNKIIEESIKSGNQTPVFSFEDGMFRLELYRQKVL